MPTYANIYFAEKQEDIPMKKVIMRLPERTRDRIIRWKLPLKSEKIIMWQVEGEKIQLPMTYTMYRLMNQDIRNSIFKKLEKSIHKKGIEHVLLPSVLRNSPFSNLNYYKGEYIKPFFIMDVIKAIVCKRLISKSLKDVEIIIVDNGNEKELEMIIDLIYPHINNLTIITNAPERFDVKIENIFSDVGLNVRTSSYNNVAISQGDIIIDTNYDDLGIIKFCKNNAIYIDIGNHAEKTIMLGERKRTVTIINDFLLSWNSETISTCSAELIMTAKGIFSPDYNDVVAILKQENIIIKNLIGRVDGREIKL